MSRGGGRGRRGGAFGGRGGFGANNLPPMGLTFSDVQNMSREENEMYPVSYLDNELLSSSLAVLLISQWTHYQC